MSERQSNAWHLTNPKLIPRDGDLIEIPNHLSVGDGGELVLKRGTSVEQAQKNLAAAVQALASQLAQANRFGGVEPPKGTVVRWTKSFEDEVHGTVRMVQTNAGAPEMHFTSPNAREYVYVAFRAPDGKWYSTAQSGSSRLTWQELLEQIADSECEIVSAWEDVPAPERLSDEATDPTAWAKLMFGKKGTVLEQEG